MGTKNAKRGMRACQEKIDFPTDGGHSAKAVTSFWRSKMVIKKPARASTRAGRH